MPTVRQAVASEVPAIAQLLSWAFADDPIERWCLACRGYRAVLELEFLEVAGQIAPEGWLWVADALHGVAAWIPPNAGYDDSAVDAVVNPVLTEHGGDPCRVTTFWAWVESHRPEVPHWYLDFIAVDPDNRGLGYGGLLLRSGLARLDGQTESVFLVTGNPRTVPWYERFGFRTLRSEDAASGWTACVVHDPVRLGSKVTPEPFNRLLAQQPPVRTADNDLGRVGEWNTSPREPALRAALARSSFGSSTTCPHLPSGRSSPERSPWPLK